MHDDRTRILVLYGTTYGQTAKIAGSIRDVLAARGLHPQLVQAGSGDAPEGLDGFSGVVIGGSLIAGKYQPAVEAFIAAHRDALNALPTAFFAVSGSAGSPDPAGRAEAERIMHGFLAAAGWQPSLTASIGGAMAYSRYNLLLRFQMRRIARKNGETDVRHDREFTDWRQVERFALEFGELVANDVVMERRIAALEARPDATR